MELALFHLKHTISNSTVINHRFLRKKKLMCLQVLMLLHLFRICLHLQQKCKIFSLSLFFFFLGHTHNAFPATAIFPAFIVCFQGTLRNDVPRLHLEELRKSLDTSCSFLGTRCKRECQLFIITYSHQFHTQARSF